MSPQPTAARWAAVTASARGGSHERRGVANQDAGRVASFDAPPGALVAAVSDGHGGERYVRSTDGARLAVDVACEMGGSSLHELDSSPDARALRNALADLARQIVEAWRSEVGAHAERHRFTPDERAMAGDAITNDPFVAYGATLIVAILAPGWIGLVQIGDGDVLFVDADGSVRTPVPGDERLVGGETTSLCLPDAHRDARVVVVELPLPRLVLLSTDGYGNSFASDQWRNDAGKGFLDAVMAAGLDTVATQLPGWLADSAKAGGDDVTMVVAQRSATTDA